MSISAPPLVFFDHCLSDLESEKLDAGWFGTSLCICEETGNEEPESLTYRSSQSGPHTEVHRHLLHAAIFVGHDGKRCAAGRLVQSLRARTSTSTPVLAFCVCGCEPKA